MVTGKIEPCMMGLNLQPNKLRLICLRTVRKCSNSARSYKTCSLSSRSKRSLLECLVTYLLLLILRSARDVLSVSLHSESSNFKQLSTMQICSRRFEMVLKRKKLLIFLDHQCNLDLILVPFKFCSF